MSVLFSLIILIGGHLEIITVEYSIRLGMVIVLSAIYQQIFIKAQNICNCAVGRK